MNQALADLKLLRRAIRARWPIPAPKRTPFLRKLFRILDTTDDPRVFLAGFRCLIEADKVNLAAEGQVIAWLKLPDRQADEGEQEEAIREIIVRTREEAQAVLSALPEAGTIP